MLQPHRSPLAACLAALATILLLTACSGGFGPQVAGVSADNDQAIAHAVQATLTAVAAAPANNEADQTAAPAQATPAVSQPAMQLPPPLPDWQATGRPASQRGQADASVTVVEYSDFQCPWCGRFYTEISPKLQPLIQDGTVRFIYKHFPVLGDDSVTAAMAAECAGAQDDFWKLHDWLFENQASWKGSGQARQLMLDAAGRLGYDAAALDACMDDDATLQVVAADFRETQEYGFRGTPSFVVNGRLIPGFLPWEQFGAIVEASRAEAVGDPLPEGIVAMPTPPPPDTDFEAEEFAVAGDPQAPVTVVEFSDYQCPYCQRFFQDTKPRLDEQYVDVGKVRFVYKDFPIDSTHAQARAAAESAECAGAQGSYWPMHDRIFQGKAEWENQEQAGEIFKGYAADLGLDTDTFDACLDNGTYADEVQADLEEGQRAGVTGTPTFFINGRKLAGAQPFEVLAQIIDSELQR